MSTVSFDKLAMKNQREIVENPFTLRHVDPGKFCLDWRGELVHEKPLGLVDLVFNQMLEEVGNNSIQSVNLDLSKVNVANTRGLTFLFFSRQRCVELGIDWGISELSTACERLIDFAGLSDFLSTSPTQKMHRIDVGLKGYSPRPLFAVKDRA